MPDYKDILKNGWHPEKAGTTFKGQVKGVFNRSKSPPRREASRPLSSLRDPSSFAPPPRRVGSGSAGSALSPASPAPAAVEAEAKAEAAAPPHPYQASRASLPTPQENVPDATYDQRPYQVDTTGLSTSHLPPPPIRRDGAGNQTLRPAPVPAVPGTNPQPPALPPRLPPRPLASRAASSSPVAAVAPPPVQSPAGTMGRLVGSASGTPQLQPRCSKLPPGLAQGGGASASSSNATNSRASPSAAEGTTWAQKQASLRTASQLQKDPGSVAMSDAWSAASTANNFRQRHGGQAATGLHAAGRLDERYGIGSRMGELAGSGATSITITQEQAGQAQPSESASSGRLVAPSGSQAVAVGSSVKKKRPPPPPPKRRGLTGASGVVDAGAADVPPQVPISARPTF